MNKLDLNAYNVSEMNAVEMRETDGGFIITKAALIKGAVWVCKWAIRFLAAAAITEACTPGSAERFQAGYDSVRNP